MESLCTKVVSKLDTNLTSLENLIKQLFQQQNYTAVIKLYNQQPTHIKTTPTIIDSFAYGLYKYKQFKEIINLWKSTVEKYGIKPSLYVVKYTLLACGEIGKNTLCVGDSVYNYIRTHAIHCDIYLDTTLMNMFIRCVNIKKSMEVWNSMQKRGVVGNKIMYLSITKSCAVVGENALIIGEIIHNYIIKSAPDILVDTKLATSILNMYLKCGKPEKVLSLWQEHIGVLFTPPRRLQLPSLLHIFTFIFVGENRRDIILIKTVLAACVEVASPYALQIGQELHNLFNTGAIDLMGCARV